MNTNINSSDLSSLADDLAFENFSRLNVGDSRITSRAIEVASNLFRNPQGKFSHAFSGKSQRKAAYRLVGNPSLTPKAMIKAITENSFEKMKAESPAQVIIPGDTSTISKEFWRKTKELGAIGEKKSSGFFFHTSLWLTLSGIPRGIVDMQIWTRPKTPKENKEAWKHLPIEKKESYRWLAAVKEVVKKLPSGTKPIFVHDRESDIHEFFEMAVGLKASFVIRHNHNRRIEGDVGKVREELKQCVPLGNITIHLPKNGNRKSQDVQVQVQAKQVTFKLREGGLAIHRNREPVTLWAMRIFGKCETEEIDWTLYTDRAINTLEEAKEILRIYTLRWRCEDFHRTLKTGMRLEANLFQKGSNLQRLLSLSAPMAVKLLELTHQARMDTTSPISEIVLPEEEKAIKFLAKEQTGRIPRAISMKKAIEYIAFAGGWMGRKGDGPPGPQTIWTGWQKVQLLAKAFKEK